MLCNCFVLVWGNAETSNEGLHMVDTAPVFSEAEPWGLGDRWNPDPPCDPRHQDTSLSIFAMKRRPIDALSGTIHRQEMTA